MEVKTLTENRAFTDIKLRDMSFLVKIHIVFWIMPLEAICPEDGSNLFL
jgi:hypothetical protein